VGTYENQVHCHGGSQRGAAMLAGSEVGYTGGGEDLDVRSAARRVNLCGVGRWNGYAVAAEVASVA
jgi:hypothetical protein